MPEYSREARSRLRKSICQGNLPGLCDIRWEAGDRLEHSDLPEDSGFDFPCLNPSALIYFSLCFPWRCVQLSSGFPLPLTQMSRVISSMQPVLPEQLLSATSSVPSLPQVLGPCQHIPPPLHPQREERAWCHLSHLESRWFVNPSQLSRGT